jgi:serine/threonine-protein kinase
MLGRYHLIEAIDEDELGELFLTRFEGPSGFQRWAVVRRLHPALEAEPKLVDAFYEAARVAAVVQHPNVVVAFDVGPREGPTWVAREYLHGESARDLVARVAGSSAHVPWDLACRIVADIAQGVETLHELRPPPPPLIGFLEGVVTPWRAIVTYDGKSKVVEGCVPLVRGRPGQGPEIAAYRAPELAGADMADIPGEVFALGVLLWELCAGQRVSGRTIPPLRGTIRCPRLMDEIIQRAVAHDPRARQASCRAFARELEGCLVSKGLVVSDDDVGRYMLHVFADRFEKREAELLSASNVTEVFDRGAIAARIAELQSSSRIRPEPPGDDEIDNTETPEVNFAFRGLSPALGSPATERSPERTESVPDAPETEPQTVRRQEAETPEVTAAVFVLATRPPASIAMPLVGKKPVPFERKKEVIRGFDELPTTKQDGLYDPPPAPGPSQSVVFVGADARPPRNSELTPEEGPPRTARMPTLEPAEESAPSLPSREPAAPPPPRRSPDVTWPPSGGPRALPLPPRPPSLSAVLIAHERRARGRGLPAAAYVAMGAAAVFALFAYLRWRATHASADEATVFKDTPVAPSASASAAPPATPSSLAVPDRAWRSVPPPPSPSEAPSASTSASTPPSTVTPTVTPKSLSPARPPDPTPVRRAPPWRPPPAAPPAAPPPSGKSGLLTVLCTPACDDVLDGARSLGPSPVFKVAVPVGSHRLTLKTNDPSVRKVVNVVVNEEDTAVVRETMDAELDPRRY